MSEKEDQGLKRPLEKESLDAEEENASKRLKVDDGKSVTSDVVNEEPEAPESDAQSKKQSADSEVPAEDGKVKEDEKNNEEPSKREEDIEESKPVEEANGVNKDAEAEKELEMETVDENKEQSTLSSVKENSSEKEIPSEQVATKLEENVQSEELASSKSSEVEKEKTSQSNPEENNDSQQEVDENKETSKSKEENKAIDLEPVVKKEYIDSSVSSNGCEEKDPTQQKLIKEEDQEISEGDNSIASSKLPNINGDDDDTVKSEGSEKENISEQEKTDVIMLSDDEENQKVLTEDSADHRSKVLKKIKELQNQLRNEEATLVLLKKLRQSQMTPVTESVPQAPVPKPPSQHLPQQIPANMKQPGGPPPLVRGGQPGQKALHSSNQNMPMRGQQMNNQSRSQQGPPPLVGVPRSGHNGQTPSSQHSSRSGMPQNLSRSNLNNRNQQPMQQQSQHQSQVQKAPVVAPAPPQDTQTPAQRQAAAKQALRKQLEKTLLQIPPPKPPPPEMNFIPSLACPDFVLLLGLEEVVNHMIDFQLIARGQKSPDERFVCTPFTCVQCGSDFTPVWKREKPGSKNVICEHCVTSNQKKALKQEHTNRLKSAFVKALQQEQEIERMQATSTHVPSPQPTNSTPQPREHSASAGSISAASAAAAAANAAAAAAAVANFRPSAEQLRQRHNYLQQAQQAQLRAGQPLGLQAFSHHAPFPYNLPFTNQQELQRQYLLDMIPRGNMSWKQ